MTLARLRPATELGLRPAPPSDPVRSVALLPAIALFLLGLLIGLLRLSGPKEELYPLSGDSEKYHKIAEGFAQLYAHPVQGIGLWLGHDASEDDLKRYGFDSWVLQHAPAYTAFLGLGYLLPGDDATTGRLLTILLFAAGSAFLYLLGRDLFGGIAGMAAGLLYLFWPSNWTYAPAILTELPVTAIALATLWFLLRTARSSRWRSWAFGGAMVGLLVLTKTTLRYLAVPLLVVEFLLERSPPGKIRFQRLIGRLLGWAVTQAIWLLFLWGFQLSPNPLSATGEDWLWIYRGNNLADRGWETVGLGDAATPALSYGWAQARRLPEPRRRPALYREAFLETVREDPVGWTALVLSKAAIFWRFPATKTDVRAGPLELPPPARWQPALAVAALIGLALTIGTGAYRSIPAIFPVYMTGLHAATHLVGRYNIPAVAFAMLYAAGAVFLISRCFVKNRGRKAIARLLGGRRLGFSRALIVLLPLAALVVAVQVNDPDPDQTRIRLRKAGDGVRLALTLPDDATPDRFLAAEILLDLLAAPKGSLDVAVRCNGTEVARLTGRLPSGPESFLLDPEVHGAQDRYRRVLRSVERHLEGAVRRRRGMEDAGYDYYRQWYRIPLDPAVAFEDRQPTIEVVLLATDGAWLDLYADASVPAEAIGDRQIDMPAFFENAYELSSYRFDALATDRRLADARLIRPVRVESKRRGAYLFDAAGGKKALKGEPRIRLRGRLPGGYGIVRDRSGREQTAYVTDPEQAVRMLGPSEIRSIQTDRDHYFDGYLTF